MSYSPVHHCYSNPEVYKGLIEGGVLVEEKVKLAHSTSLVEQPFDEPKTEKVSPFTDKRKTKLVSH